MDSSTYFTILIKQVPDAEEEVLGAFLFENGAAGIQENLQFSQRDKKYLPEIVEAPVKDLLIYFEKKPDSGFLEKLAKDYSNFQIEINECPLKDWLSEWKAQWKPFPLVGDIWVVPDWEKKSFPTDGKQAIYIEPGMAFGTGTHATTQIASLLLKNLRRKHELNSLVDVGTGSGILSIVASLVGFKNIYAYDNDSESHRVFHENLIKNSSQGIFWEEYWEQNLKGQVEVCLANIIDGVLLELKPKFQQLESRYYIFTGILQEREKDFLKEMTEDWNLELLERHEKEEWVGFCFKGPQ